MNWLPRKAVVVPIDFSDDSFAALATAVEIATDRSHVRVVHVLSPLEPADPGVIWHTIDDAGRKTHAAEALKVELVKRGYEGLDIHILIGNPGNEIAGYAEEVDAGLVVISCRGRSAIDRLLLGSVADRVVRLAHCPVLVLKR